MYGSPAPFDMIPPLLRLRRSGCGRERMPRAWGGLASGRQG